MADKELGLIRAYFDDTDANEKFGKGRRAGEIEPPVGAYTIIKIKLNKK